MTAFSQAPTYTVGSLPRVSAACKGCSYNRDEITMRPDATQRV